MGIQIQWKFPLGKGKVPVRCFPGWQQWVPMPASRPTLPWPWDRLSFFWAELTISTSMLHQGSRENKLLTRHSCSIFSSSTETFHRPFWWQKLFWTAVFFPRSTEGPQSQESSALPPSSSWLPCLSPAQDQTTLFNQAAIAQAVMQKAVPISSACTDYWQRWLFPRTSAFTCHGLLLDMLSCMVLRHSGG